MERERRGIIQDEIHIEEVPQGPVKGANRGVEVEGAWKRGGPWRVVMIVLGQRAQRQRPEGGADTRNQQTQVRSRQSGNGTGRAEQEKLITAHGKNKRDQEFLNTLPMKKWALLLLPLHLSWTVLANRMRRSTKETGASCLVSWSPGKVHLQPWSPERPAALS